MPEDQDPQETQEWRDALDSVVDFDGPDRAAFLLKELYEEAHRHAVAVPYSANTPYLNTIPVDKQPAHPGDTELERIVRSLNRWNAVATVLRANKESSELGGHIASFQSSATLYDTGFNHFWHAPHEGHGGDLLFVQGHVAPGIYARAFLEGRLTEEQLLGFRQEVAGGGLSSYPHPWLMPDFWQFPTVSMGLGPLMVTVTAPDGSTSTVSAMSSPAFTPTMPAPRMRLLPFSNSTFVRPSSRPMPSARPLAAQGNTAFSYSTPCALASGSESPIHATSGSV